MRKRLIGLSVASVLLAMTGTAAAETVKIGVLGVFSGAFSRWGQQFQQAIAVYQKHHGDTVNGHKIEIIYRDVGGPDPAKARQLTEELILREKVQFLGGYVFTPNALAVADLVTEAKVPTVIFNAATSVITRRSPMFVRTSFTLPQAAVPLAAWMPKNKMKRVVTVVSDYAPGHDGEAAFIRVFKENGGEVLESIRIPLSTTDFAPFFERVLQQKPDAIFLFGPGGPASVGMINTWATRLKPAGIELTTTNETQEIDLPKIGKSALDSIGSSHYTETIDNPLNKKLRADLEAMFGKDTIPDTATVSTYDGLHVIYQTIAKLGPRPNPEEAVKFMASLKFDSPRGPVQMDPATRDITQNIYLRRVVDNNGRLQSRNFETVPMVKDPWKEWNPEKK
jgi:branched-chain amino acid transport system substrate-binding protein